MRWLLVKDLQILRRSPLTVAVLVIYPVVVALLVGVALSRGPERPKIAFFNEVPRGETLQIGGQKLDLGVASRELRARVNAVEVGSRAEAERKVRNGDVLGALIVPEDTVSKLRSGLERPRVEVIVNEEDPLKARLVEDAIDGAVAEANQRVSRALVKTTLRYLNLLLEGGSVSVLGNDFPVLGLERIGRITEDAVRRLPAGSRERRDLEQVVRFNRLAQQNYSLTGKALSAISQPIEVKKEVLKGSAVALTDFAAAIAVAVSLMFVAVLLASGSLALEREQNVFGRLVRGPVSRTALLAEKVILAVTASGLVGLVMLALLGSLVDLDWSRVHLWVAALLLSAAAFATLGTLIGALAREVATASLVAFALLLPLVFAALVPSGTVSEALYAVIRVVSATFPFDASLDAFSAALYGNGGMAGPLAHLAGLALAFGIASRIALRRLG